MIGPKENLTWLYWSRKMHTDSSVHFIESHSSNLESPGMIYLGCHYVVEKISVHTKAKRLFDSAVMHFHLGNKLWGEWPLWCFIRPRRGREALYRAFIPGQRLAIPEMLPFQFVVRSPVTINEYVTVLLEGTKTRPVC